MYSNGKSYGLWLSISHRTNGLFPDFSQTINPWKSYLHLLCCKTNPCLPPCLTLVLPVPDAAASATPQVLVISPALPTSAFDRTCRTLLAWVPLAAQSL